MFARVVAKRQARAGMGMGTAPSFPAMPVDHLASLVLCCQDMAFCFAMACFAEASNQTQEIDKMAEMLARMNQESMGGNQDVSGNQRGTSAAPSTMVPGGQASGKRTFTGNPLG